MTNTLDLLNKVIRLRVKEVDCFPYCLCIWRIPTTSLLSLLCTLPVSCLHLYVVPELSTINNISFISTNNKPMKVSKTCHEKYIIEELFINDLLMYLIT